VIEAEGVARRSIVGLAIACEGGLWLIALSVGWFLARPPHEQIVWSATGLGQGLAAALPLLAAAWVMTRWPVGPLAALEELVRRQVMPLFRNCTTLDLLIVSAFAGIGEELLFRGVVQTGVAQFTGSAATGLVVGGAVFGLAHPITATYAVVAGLIGLYLGGLQLATDNLLVPIVTHAAYDFGALVYLLRGGGIPGTLDDVSIERATINELDQ
jgi:hypothetical protein